MNIIEADYAISDEERSQIIFRGDLIVFRQLPAMLSLCHYVDQLLSKVLGEVPPELAQHHLSSEEYLKFVFGMQQRFKGDSKAKALFLCALKQVGVQLSSTYYDYFPLRVVSAQQKFITGLRTAVGHHRDTWGGNMQAQCNWWAPIYDLEAQRTIAFYPDYWDKPTINTTADWSFDKYVISRRETPMSKTIPYPEAPQILQTIDEENAVKVVLNAGDILCFSSAHLHASVPNTTDLTRYSVEMRTVNIVDLESGRGAPNVDNTGGKPRYNWYRHAVNGLSLSNVIE